MPEMRCLDSVGRGWSRCKPPLACYHVMETADSSVERRFLRAMGPGSFVDYPVGCPCRLIGCDVLAYLEEAGGSLCVD